MIVAAVLVLFVLIAALVRLGQKEAKNEAILKERVDELDTQQQAAHIRDLLQRDGDFAQRVRQRFTR